ncbi:MAG: hypothetical protein QM765_16400 [Myxococcales bacterium]
MSHADVGTASPRDAGVVAGSDAGPQQTGGVGTFLNVGFFDQHLAAGPDGTMHLTFMDGAAERVYYGSCKSGCGNPAAWNPVLLRTNAQLGVTTVGPYGIGVDATGRIHRLISAVTQMGQSANALVYATCAAGCGSAANWTYLDLSSLSVGNEAVGTSRPFMVQPSGRVSFLTSEPGIYFACDGNCTSLSSWSAAVSLNGNPLHAAIDGAGVTHVMLATGYTTNNERVLQYSRCASSCTVPASWQTSAVGFLSRGNDWGASLAVTAGGRVFMAYNQGEITVSQQDNRKLLLASCAGSGCLDLDSWSTVVFPTLDEGLDGSWIETSGESAVLVSTSLFDLNLRGCDQDCHLASSWGAPVAVDSSNAINASWPPDTGSSCPGNSESANWWPRRPTVGVNSTGVVVVHNPTAIVKCPGTSGPSSLPPIGRVISTF